MNCAAYTNAEKAEDDIENARKPNRDAVKNIATVAKENDATLIHISTDFVYDGKKAVPYQETDEKNPVSSPEEIAFKNGWIDKTTLIESAERYGKSPYGQHLRKVAEGKIHY